MLHPTRAAQVAADLSDLPAGHGFQIELKLTDTTANKSKPMIESLSLSFK